MEPLKAALGAGQVACMQLRLPLASDDAVREACETLLPVAQQYDVAFILNDRADLAAEQGCDGVHVGQEDIAYGEARKIVGEDKIVGVTCKASRDLAFAAGEAGADYVAFGAFFKSYTKENYTPADMNILSWWQEIMTLPCVAIGGITVKNCKTVIDAGPDFIAVSSGIWSYPSGPAAAVEAFNQKLAQS